MPIFFYLFPESIYWRRAITFNGQVKSLSSNCSYYPIIAQRLSVSCLAINLAFGTKNYGHFNCWKLFQDVEKQSKKGPTLLKWEAQLQLIHFFPILKMLDSLLAISFGYKLLSIKKEVIRLNMLVIYIIHKFFMLYLLSFLSSMLCFVVRYLCMLLAKRFLNFDDRFCTIQHNLLNTRRAEAIVSNVLGFLSKSVFFCKSQ